MTESIQETVLVGVAMTVVAVVVLRLVAASYFVWKGDQAAKGKLRYQLNEPERLLRADLRKFSIDNRKDLSESLAELSAIASLKSETLDNAGINGQYLTKLNLKIDRLINQLSYDFPVRIAALNFKKYCFELISGKRTDLTTLWERRKLTFKLLHKEDYIDDQISLIELSILIEDEEGKAPFGMGGVHAELANRIRQLGDDFYSPKVRDDIRNSLQSEYYLGE